MIFDKEVKQLTKLYTQFLQADSFIASQALWEEFMRILKTIPQPDRVRVLASASLKGKWYKGSKIRISTSCPFCLATYNESLSHNCDICVCPEEICDYHGYHGKVSTLGKSYTLIRDLPATQLKEMIDLFLKI